MAHVGSTGESQGQERVRFEKVAVGLQGAMIARVCPNARSDLPSSTPLIAEAAVPEASNGGGLDL
jgi:hypothetical protein